ncbi:MAG: hypothetical protein QOJ38_1541 [Solirubrobacterales bacterium]|jgi:hypothetical protein|nr:hypothetical protein [Solirubrobacterales bacterium]
MYRFSRSIYRELSPYVVSEQRDGVCQARQDLLEACEETMRRLAYDRRYFARPARTLFSDVRTHFPISEQLRVYKVIERYVGLALDHLSQLPAHGIGLDGRPRECVASTRKGTPCQREPLPGRDYCPSHKHLEEPIEALDGVGAAA